MKTNNQLTTDNIVYLLNQEKYTVEQLMSTIQDDPNRFRIWDYNKVITRFLDYFFIDYKSEPLEIETPSMGALVLINEKTKNKWLEDFSTIEFNGLYQNIMAKMWREGTAKFNIYEFGVLFDFMVTNSKKIKSDTKISETGRLLFKYLLNYTFGACANPFGKSLIYFDNLDKVPLYTKTTFEYMFEKNPHNIFYIDVDQIYLDYVSPEVLSSIKSLNLPFTIENGLNGIFMEKKKYLIQKANSVKPHGLRSSFRSRYKLEKNRINKLRKILNNINATEQ